MVDRSIVAANRTQTLIPPLVSAGAYWGYPDGSLRILQLDTLKVWVGVSVCLCVGLRLWPCVCVCVCLGG